jgi:hypothetical protein
MKLPRFVGLLLAPVLFWLGCLGFAMMVVANAKGTQDQRDSSLFVMPQQD